MVDEELSGTIRKKSKIEDGRQRLVCFFSDYVHRSIVLDDMDIRMFMS